MQGGRRTHEKESHVNEVKIILIANAGILIEYQDQQLLIDALQEGHRLFPPTPPQAMTALLEGREPFKDLKAVMVTHNHPDHFSTRLTLPVLARHRGTRFIADESSAAALLQASREASTGFDPERIAVMPWQLPDAEIRAAGAFERVLPPQIKLGPFTIQPVPFEHEGQRYATTPNVGLMIDVAGCHILYPGDARMSPDNYAILANHLPPVDIAVLMFPYIATSRGQNLVRSLIRPRSLIAVHWPDPERDHDQLTEHARRYFDRTRDSLMQTWFLERYLDTVSFSTPGATD